MYGLYKSVTFLFSLCIGALGPRQLAAQEALAAIHWPPPLTFPEWLDDGPIPDAFRWMAVSWVHVWALRLALAVYVYGLCRCQPCCA